MDRDKDPIEKIKTQLDKDFPRWWKEWGTARELERFVSQYEISMATTNLRNAVAQRLFYPIINAALEAGVITTKEGEDA